MKSKRSVWRKAYEEEEAKAAEAVAQCLPGQWAPHSRSSWPSLPGGGFCSSLSTKTIGTSLKNSN